MAVALGSCGGCTGVRSLGCSARGLLAHAPDGVNYAGLTRSQRRLNVRLARSPSWRLLPRPNSDECAEEIRRVGMRRVCVQRKKVAVTISVCRECSLDVANSRPGRVSVLNAKEEKSPGEINALATSAAPGERISDLQLNHAADPLLNRPRTPHLREGREGGDVEPN